MDGSREELVRYKRQFKAMYLRLGGFKGRSAIRPLLLSSTDFEGEGWTRTARLFMRAPGPRGGDAISERARELQLLTVDQRFRNIFSGKGCQIRLMCLANRSDAQSRQSKWVQSATRSAHEMYPDLVIREIEGLESPVGVVMNAIEYELDEGESSIRVFRSLSSSLVESRRVV
jgi:hypothetical protein